MFLPNCAGTYVAHVQVFSHSCVKKYDVYQDAIPVNVTLQAIAEDPWISVCYLYTVEYPEINSGILLLLLIRKSL
jgi:hypothetical protein